MAELSGCASIGIDRRIESPSALLLQLFCGDKEKTPLADIRFKIGQIIFARLPCPESGLDAFHDVLQVRFCDRIIHMPPLFFAGQEPAALHQPQMLGRHRGR